MIYIETKLNHFNSITDLVENLLPISLQKKVSSLIVSKISSNEKKNLIIVIREYT